MNYEVDLKLINNYNTHKVSVSNAALLVIDMQETFRSDGDLISHKQIENVKYLISFAKQNKMPVIFVRHNDSSSDSQNIINWWGNKLEKGSKSWEIISDIDTTGCTIIDKSQYSAFYNTNLNDILKEKLIDSVIISGLMTNICCETSARDAFMKGYNVIFVNDATSTINEDLHLSAIKNISFGCGIVVNTHDINNFL